MSAEKTMDEKQGRRRRRRQEIEEAKLSAATEAELVDDDEDDDLEDERGVTERKGRATPGRRTQVEDAPTGNIVVRTLRGLGEYLEGVRSELDKVAWPTRSEINRLTRVVLGTTIVSALVLGLIGLIFTELFRIGLDAPAILLGVIAIAVVVAVVFTRRANKRTSPY
jgi:preprotein translocase SecE subunit